MSNNESKESFIFDEQTSEFFADWDRKITYNIGFEDGIKKSQLENINSIAKEMIKGNESIDKIQKYTNLSLQEINDLKEEMK